MSLCYISHDMHRFEKYLDVEWVGRFPHVVSSRFFYIVTSKSVTYVVVSGFRVREHLPAPTDSHTVGTYGGLKNPGFEADAVSSWQYMEPANWTGSGAGIVVIRQGDAAWGGTYSNSGLYYAGIQGAGYFLKQTLPLVGAHMITISFLIRKRTCTCPDPTVLVQVLRAFP
jgi:hypothetical protein